ncbi:DUF397 domain-containing protein [Streptomyces sp. AV19]|uniref:DUF397 domain-containing protein n=1 Tax=Streptomyces sp. AV19 TaxID=2793068 RepID=UPI0018FE9DD4|nr:DUF397 domain-containing protein [Streptomyces sp. AV19]MBH1938252.1 DUF397 domain-containing protein [Streptomyces sp. AV19]MDG4534882.1 DUF397 domain-containing protein [Streptomyces sp. AV19]
MSEMVWRKSSYSTNTGTECLEVADSMSDCIPVRDSKIPHGSTISFPAPSWSAFLAGLWHQALP